MPHAEVDGIQIAYDDRGSGEPALLFTTGWCSNRARWARVVELSSPHRRVLNTEWRGHGDSDPAPADFGLEEQVADVLAVADAAGVERFVPCAASTPASSRSSCADASPNESRASSTSTGTSCRRRRRIAPCSSSSPPRTTGRSPATG